MNMNLPARNAIGIYLKGNNISESYRQVTGKLNAIMFAI